MTVTLKKTVITFGLFLLFVLPRLTHSQTPDSLRQLIIEDIEIVGNNKTKPGVIHRYLTIRKGDAITAELIDLNYQRLSQTNFFKEVDFYTLPGSEKGKVIVVIEVQERGWVYFQFEGGHNDLDGWFFVPASLRFDNLFGRGNRLGIRLFVGDRISKLSLFYRTESLFDNSAFLDLELLAGDKQFIHYFGSTRAEQEVPFGGFRFKIGGTERFFKHLYFGFRTEGFEPESFAVRNNGEQVGLPAVIADDLGRNQVAAFSIGLDADLRDNRAYPLRGFWGGVAAEWSHDEIGSDVNFSKITFDGRFYRRVWRRQVLAFHLKGGYTTSGSPFYERFYLGGANSLRGHPDRRLTPVGWGTKLILTNTEFRFPLSHKNFPNHSASAVLFFDAGGIWQENQTPSLDDFFTSLGFGFRVKLPIVGMTRFDFAIPLQNIDDNDFQFHLSFGHTF